MPQEVAGRWIPLESNPEVFNDWAKKTGVVMKHLEFVDIYALDDEVLKQIPRPVKAVILLFPIDKSGETERKEEDERIAKTGQAKVDDTIFWVKQTIPNACGTIGLIHALANSGIIFTPTSALQKFIYQCRGKTPEERAELLSTSPLFANVHAETASTGQSDKKIETDLHFTCFVEAPDQDFRKAARNEDVDESSVFEPTTGMRLIELDGRRAGPIDRGECQELLSDAVSFIESQYVSTSKSLYFSLVALVEKPIKQ